MTFSGHGKTNENTVGGIEFFLVRIKITFQCEDTGKKMEIYSIKNSINAKLMLSFVVKRYYKYIKENEI